MVAWKKFPLPLVIAAGGLTAIVLIATLKPKPEANTDTPVPTAKPQVKAQRAVPQSTTLSVFSQGSIAPRREIDLVAQVSGQVQSVEPAFVSGGHFRAGALLLQIEDRDYRAAYLDAQARLAQAEQLLAEERGRVRQAKREWRDLGNAEANDLFLRRPQLATAEASVQSARANLARAELNLERTQIRAPFDGRVRNTLVDLGEYVSPGTHLASVYDSRVLEVRLPLTDQQLALVALPLGFKAEAAAPAPAVTLRGVIAGREHQWQGRIARTDASIDERTRMVYAIAEIQVAPDSPQAPVVGLFVQAEIEGQQLDEVLVLPRDAVFNRDRIYTLDADNKIEERRAQVLQRTRDTVWLRAEEIPADTWVLQEKQALLSAGTEVEPVNGSAVAKAEAL